MNWKQDILSRCKNDGWLTAELNEYFNDNGIALDENDPEVIGVLEEGRKLSYAWWMNLARKNITSPHFHNATFRFIMQNCFSNDDKQNGKETTNAK